MINQCIYLLALGLHSLVAILSTTPIKRLKRIQRFLIICGLQKDLSFFDFFVDLKKIFRFKTFSVNRFENH